MIQYKKLRIKTEKALDMLTEMCYNFKCSSVRNAEDQDLEN